MRTGRMNRLVTLKLRTQTGQDAYGEETERWTNVPIWAERRELRGQERFVAQQQLATLDGRYLIHYRRDVTVQDFLIDGSQTFNIQAVLFRGRREGLELVVTQSPLFAAQWNDPAPAPYRMLLEAPYYLIVQRLGESPAIEDDAGFLIVSAQTPTGDASGYDVWTGVTDPYAQVVYEASLSPIGLLAAAIEPEVTTDTTFTAVWDINLVELNTYCWIEAEICEVIALDAGAGTLTLKRGILDTVPQSHSSAVRIYFSESRTAEDPTEYSSGETVKAKCLPITVKGTLAIESAPEDTLVMEDRPFRPYCPGKFQLNAAYWPTYLVGALTVTWAHRDRLQQLVEYIAQDAADIGPEALTTYTVRIYNEEDDLQKEVTGIELTTYLYPIADEMTDSGLGRPNESMRVTLFAVREGFDSWQMQDHTLPECEGYGMFFGAYYGE